MKKLVLLSLVLLLNIFLWATDPGKIKLQKPLNNRTTRSAQHGRNNIPKTLRSGTLQKVVVGKAGNLLSVLNANCHQIDVDSTLNTVLFIHRSDTVTGTSYNVAQYRYDISKNGGTSWNVNIGPLNPIADNITINGRYPEAVIRPDSAYPTNPDSAYIVYNGSWHNGASPIAVWQGQYYGVGKLDGDTTTYTEHHQIVNNANVEISTSMIESYPGHYWNLNLDYTELSTSTDTVRGIIIERGVWSDSAGEVVWSYQDYPIGSALTYNNGAVVGNNLNNPIISFDPTGKYGWIVMEGDITNDANFSTRPIYMISSDSGQTWTTPQDLDVDNLPGMFPTDVSAGSNGKTIIGDAQVVVDSAGNPHIIAVVGQTDTTNDEYVFYPFQTMVLYDLYYNPTVASCSWQANMLSTVFGYFGDYTSDNAGDGNRVQISRSKDGKKIFVFWTDTDSLTVAGIESTATGSTAPNTNTNPNLFGIGIDMGIRKITNVVDFTVGDNLFGGATQYPTVVAGGTFGGALFPVICPNVFNQGGGNFNIPAVLTQPDYLNSNMSTWSSVNPAQFYYCQNINFTQSQFVNSFDNAPPTLTVFGPDTVFILLGQPYVHDSATAYDCVYGIIHPSFTSNVSTNGSGNTDSVGIYQSTWTASNPLGNTSSFTQVVIVAAPPIANFVYYPLSGTGYRFQFIDTSLNFPTTRSWNWGDGTTNNLNETRPIKVYTTGGTKCVTLTVTNQYGTSDTIKCIQVHLAGINDMDLANKIAVYPNPSAGSMTMELADDIAEGAKVSAYNMLGQQVSEPIEIKSGITLTTLNLGNLETGVYMLKVETPSGTAVKQITINK